MLVKQRHATILDMVRQRGAVSQDELQGLLGVSPCTIRRDLNALAGDGRLMRVYGGAVANRARWTDRSERTERRVIAAYAAGLVEPGISVGLPASPVAPLIADFLLDLPRITVVTNSLDITKVFAGNGRDDQTVILLGGVRGSSGGTVGPLAVEALRGLAVDLALMHVHGFHPAVGYTAADLLEAELARAMSAISRRVVALAEHSAWNRAGIRTVGALTIADQLVTTEALSGDARATLEDALPGVVVLGLDTRNHGAEPTHHEARG